MYFVVGSFHREANPNDDTRSSRPRSSCDRVLDLGLGIAAGCLSKQSPSVGAFGIAAKHLDPAYQTALIICAALNLAMLFIEGSAGLWIGSAALLADAGDFLEDATVLGLAFVAIGWSIRARGAAGLVQGFAMAGVGIGAIVEIVLGIVEGGAPSPALVGGVGSARVDREWVLRVSTDSLSWRRCLDACNLAVDAK